MAKRSYFLEITEVEKTWNTVWRSPSVVPKDIDSNWISGSAFCIGSGGSLSLAKLWEYFHESHNLGIAKSLTPYEFYHTISTPDIVVLFSASGKNHDILQVFKKAIAIGCRVLIFSMTHSSALVRLSESYPKQSYAVYPRVSTPKDGFLAVNSVIAISCLIAHFEKYLLGNNFEYESPVQLAIKHNSESPISTTNLSKIKTIQIISSEWGMPAGWDLESRLAESGVCSCFLTDPRNFGHGRFLWYEQWKDITLMINFYSKESESFITKFQRTLPADSQIYSIASPYSGVWGGIYCITRSIALFSDLAKQRLLDPGKPKVPQWGRKLHSLHYKNDEMEYKQKNINDQKQYAALHKEFSGIVLDYDGTLVDTKNRLDPIRKEIIMELKRLLELGLKIGIATGRGQSIIKALQNDIPSDFHHHILVGQHNGVTLSLLSEDAIILSENIWPLCALIKSIIIKIKPEKIKISEKPAHISIRKGTSAERTNFLNDILTSLGQYSQFMKYKVSGHSIDIFPIWASKLSVVVAIAESANTNILCIGDQGQIDGNDEELLSWDPSISVGKKRPFSNACLWLGKEKKYQESSGTLLILKNIHKNGPLFNLNQLTSLER